MPIWLAKYSPERNTIPSQTRNFNNPNEQQQQQQQQQQQHRKAIGKSNKWQWRARLHSTGGAVRSGTRKANRVICIIFSQLGVEAPPTVHRRLLVGLAQRQSRNGSLGTPGGRYFRPRPLCRAFKGPTVRPFTVTLYLGPPSWQHLPHLPPPIIHSPTGNIWIGYLVFFWFWFSNVELVWHGRVFIGCVIRQLLLVFLLFESKHPVPLC